MTDTNIQSEGECQECLRHEKDGQLLCDKIAKLEQENKELREALENHKTLITALDKYVLALTAELQQVSPIACIHGWRSGSAEKGVEMRALIDRARKLLEP